MKKLIVVCLMMLMAVPAMAVETHVDRARVIMSRIKDNTSPLELKATAEISTRYADAFVFVYGNGLLVDEEGIPIAIGDVPAADKAKLYINVLRKYHEEVLSASVGPAAADAARVIAIAAAKAQAATDLGTTE